MVKIPAEFVPSVGMATPSPGYIQAQSVEPAQSPFGAQLQKLGEAAASLGEGYGRLVRSVEDASNDANVKKLDLQFDDFATREVNNYLRSQMDDAKSQYPQVEDSLRRKAEEILALTENGIQRGMLSRVVDKRMSGYMSHMDRHAGDQLEKHNRFQAGARAQSMLRSARQERDGWWTEFDPTVTDNAWRDFVQSAESELAVANPGVPRGTEGWNALVMNSMSPLIQGVVTDLLQSKQPDAIEEAQFFLEAQLSNNRIDPDKAAGLRETIANYKLTRDSVAWSESYLASNPKASEDEAADALAGMLADNTIDANQFASRLGHVNRMITLRDHEKKKTDLALVEQASQTLNEPLTDIGTFQDGYKLGALAGDQAAMALLAARNPDLFASVMQRGLMKKVISEAQGKLDNEDPAWTRRLYQLRAAGQMATVFQSETMLRDAMMGRVAPGERNGFIEALKKEKGEAYSDFQLTTEDRLKRVFLQSTKRTTDQGLPDYSKLADQGIRNEFEAFKQRSKDALLKWVEQNTTPTNPKPIPSESDIYQFVLPEAFGNKVTVDEVINDEYEFTDLTPEQIKNAFVTLRNGEQVMLGQFTSEVSAAEQRELRILAVQRGIPNTWQGIIQYWADLKASQKAGEISKPQTPQSAPTAPAAPAVTQPPPQPTYVPGPPNIRGRGL